MNVHQHLWTSHLEPITSHDAEKTFLSELFQAAPPTAEMTPPLTLTT